MDLSKEIGMHDVLKKRGSEACPSFDAWADNGVYSERLGIIVAPEDLWVVEANNLKLYWTRDEFEAFKMPRVSKDESGDYDPLGGWRLPTDDEWHMLLEEFGTEDGDTDHRILMTKLGLVYGGYVQEDDVSDYNWHPHDPSFIHNVGNSGCYASSCGVNDDSRDPTALNRYFYFLKEKDRVYGCEYVGTCGSAAREAYRVRLVRDK